MQWKETNKLDKIFVILGQCNHKILKTYIFFLSNSKSYLGEKKFYVLKWKKNRTKFMKETNVSEY